MSNSHHQITEPPTVPTDGVPMGWFTGDPAVFHRRQPFQAARNAETPVVPNGDLPDMEALRQAHGLSNRS